MHWYFAVLKKYGVFEGRAGREEFWYFALIQLLLYGVLTVIVRITGSESIDDFRKFCVLAFFIPSLAVAVRRLHDTNRTGWWGLIGPIPVVGLVLIFFLVERSHPFANQYGWPPIQGGKPLQS
jgi:uncharacterized membrane protein YhaH (DUF805 family)